MIHGAAFTVTKKESNTANLETGFWRAFNLIIRGTMTTGILHLKWNTVFRF